MRTALATLRFHAYCGMTSYLEETSYRVDIPELRREAAKVIRGARRGGQYVHTLFKGLEWEFETPEDAVLVSDGDGLLYLHIPELGEMEGDPCDGCCMDRRPFLMCEECREADEQFQREMAEEEDA